MIRKILSIVLCICILCSIVALYASAAHEVCFISVNDTLSELNYMPYFKNGVTYLPYWVFTNFGIGYSYFAENTTAMVYQGKSILLFNLVTGVTYDINDEFYSAQAIFRNGVVYLPTQFIQEYFPCFVYTYIQGSPYGDIVRLKDSSAVFNDTDFVKAATSLMRSRYNAYMASIAPSPTPTQTPKPTPTPVPTPSPSPEINHEGVPVYLCFVGLPSDTIFSTLKTYNADACFYLTADDIRSSPDTVRRIDGEGHSIGILCYDNIEQEYEEASELLFEAARIKTVMVTTVGENPSDLANEADAADLSFWYYNLDGLYSEGDVAYSGMLTTIMDTRHDKTSIFFTCGKTTEGLLRPFLFYLFDEKYSVTCPKETDVWLFE